MENVAIIGAGQGGFQAAASLRQEGFVGRIALIGNEPCLPYQRPPLSKSYLKSGDASKLTLRKEEFFSKNEIELHLGSSVERIDRAKQLVCVGQDALPYDQLIIATGCRNLRPAIPGIETTLDLRTLADAGYLRDATMKAKSCIVIGGGFIGLEYAAVAAGLGLTVTVIERAERLMARAVSKEMSEAFAQKHREIGVDIRLELSATAVDNGHVTLSDGSQISADLVLLAAGVLPNTELAANAGLKVDNGIAVDDQLKTSDPRISALGDCASFPLAAGKKRVRLESIQAATDHARHIAKRLVHGGSSSYEAVPWFWSDQADWKLQIAGVADANDSSEVQEDGSVLRFRNGTLTAVETVNAPKLHMQSRRLFAAQSKPTREDAYAALDLPKTQLERV